MSMIRASSFFLVFVILAGCSRVPVEQLIADLKSGDDKKQNAAARALVKRRDRSVDALAALLKEDDVLLKAMVLQVLGRISTVKASTAALKALQDQSPDVRLQAAKIFVSAPLPENGLPPFTSAAADRYWSVRREIVTVLSRYDTKEATEVIAGLLRDDNENVRKHAIQTLLLMKNPHVVKVLIDALQLEDDQVRFIAVQALGTLQDTIASAPLLEIMKTEENTHIRQKTAVALGLLHCRTALPLLNKMAAEGTLDEKRAALQALEVMKAQ